MNVAVPDTLGTGTDSDVVYSNTLAQLEVIIWDLKREMLRGVSKIIDEDYDELCKKYCPVSRLIQSTGTMVVPGIQPIQETLEESVYVHTATSSETTRTQLESETGKPKKQEHSQSRARTRARLDRPWLPELHCHCRRVTGFCYGSVKNIEEGRRMCKYHHNHYIEYKRGNHERNQWFGFVEEKPNITNTNPIIFRKWRDGKILKGDTYDIEGEDIYVKLKHHSCYAALYITPPESQAQAPQATNILVQGYFNIYTSKFVTLPVCLWDVKMKLKEQRDPEIISEELGYPVYILE